MGDIAQSLDPNTLLAQPDATRVADPTVDQLDAPNLLQLILKGFADTARQLDQASRQVTPENLANVATMLGPVGDVRAVAVDAPEQFGEGQNVAGIISLLSAIPGGIGAFGDLLRKGTTTGKFLGRATSGADETADAALFQEIRQGRQQIEAFGELPHERTARMAQEARIAARSPSAPSQLFQGLEGLDAQGLRVFAKSTGPATREIVSLTPNPKVPGGWKATIFEEVEGKGHDLLNTADFASHDEAVAALSGGQAFFKDFTEIPVGSAEAMEQFFRSISQ